MTTSIKSRVPDDLHDDDQMRTFHDRQDRIVLRVGELPDVATDINGATVSAPDLATSLNGLASAINSLLAIHRIK